MNSVDTNAVLNRLLVLHNRSLAMYLSDAMPWSVPEDESARAVLRQIADDHRAMVDRLGEMILEGDGTVAFGEYPLRFTAYHDLSFDFLLEKLIEDQKQLVDQIAQCVDQLRLTPPAQSIAQEALGEAKGHLESLEELRAQRAATKRQTAACG